MPFSVRWPKSGSMRSGAAYERPTLARHIGVTAGSASPGTDNWPTPDALLFGNQPNANTKKWGGNNTLVSLAQSRPTPHGFNGQDADGGYGTGGEFEKYVKQWTTPCADDTGTRTSRYQQGGTALSLPATTAQWATPDTAIALGGHLSRGGSRSEELLLRGQVNQWGRELGPDSRPDPATATDGPPTSKPSPTSRLQLNERFVEALMGLPSGWTDCAPSATPSCQIKPSGPCASSGSEHSE
jgi:hypothetical protein